MWVGMDMCGCIYACVVGVCRYRRVCKCVSGYVWMHVGNYG